LGDKRSKRYEGKDKEKEKATRRKKIEILGSV